MRRLVATVFSIVASTASAMAADMAPSYKAAPMAAAAVFSWTGSYIGLNAGGTWGRWRDNPSTTVNLTGVTTAIPGTFANRTDFVGGFQTGYNWQIGSWVLGVEQDIQYSRLRSSFVYAAAPGGALVAGDGFSNKVDFLGATRVRAGWAFDRSLLYVAGGLETAVMDTSGNYVARAGGSPAATFTDADKYHFGWTIGGGYQYAITNNVALGAEYRYFDLGRETYNLGAVTNAAGVTSTVTDSVRLKASQVLLRLDMKLNGFFGM